MSDPLIWEIGNVVAPEQSMQLWTACLAADVGLLLNRTQSPMNLLIGSERDIELLRDLSDSDEMSTVPGAFAFTRRSGTARVLRVTKELLDNRGFDETQAHPEPRPYIVTRATPSFFGCLDLQVALSLPQRSEDIEQVLDFVFTEFTDNFWT